MKKLLFYKTIMYILVVVCLVSCKPKPPAFYETDIRGRITMIVQRNDYWLIGVDKKEFKFKLKSFPDNMFSFSGVARIGDTIIKASDSDTLYLRRGGNDYGYTLAPSQ